jgi:DNA end-binding protein Ku
MAPRSNWKGYLKLSLVSASIAIYPATSSSEKVRFNTLNRATGNRLKRQMVDGVTGDVVESDEQVKGYAVGKDQFVVVEDDELANVAIESSHTVDIEKFVPKVSIDDRYRDTPYYLAPEDKVGNGSRRTRRSAIGGNAPLGRKEVRLQKKWPLPLVWRTNVWVLDGHRFGGHQVRSEDAIVRVANVAILDGEMPLSQNRPCGDWRRSLDCGGGRRDR